MKTGKIVSYNPINRLGEIKLDDGAGPLARFYLRAVTNADPLPKRNDKVQVEAPEIRKNKQGKSVQGDATSVEIVERAPEEPPKPVYQQNSSERSSFRDKPRRDRKPRRDNNGRDNNRARTEKGAGIRTERVFRENAPNEDRNSRENRPRKPRIARSQRESRSKQDNSIPYQCNPTLVVDRFFNAEINQQSENALKRAFIYSQKYMIPWGIIRSRRDQLFKNLSESGLIVEMIELRSLVSLEIGRVKLHTNFGYPYLPAKTLRSELDSIAEEADRSAVIFDAIPKFRVTRMSLENEVCVCDKGAVFQFVIASKEESAAQSLRDKIITLCCETGLFEGTVKFEKFVPKLQEAVVASEADAVDDSLTIENRDEADQIST
jgi:hypothetical protein